MPKLNILQSRAFKSSYKKYRHNKKVLIELESVLLLLCEGKPLPGKYRDHALKGNLKGIRECHLLADDLLLYFVVEDQGLLKLYDMGSHADIFGM